ncbi:hypothetical protein GALMADRAFT_103267 [Galerina marginata CBS 339.88]|uniref:EH domain-containing protein n=1 Tax=Galerina marginata (strain CBS 339.88) TaxID=685588 RepID=A0A067SJE2_GALM3|nr:hypothetical protein GALMADRAFT_103267 [Galerina marginata CBS 339.88]
MSTGFLESPASDDELLMANRLLEKNIWTRPGSLSFDSAVGIFRQNGLSPTQVRDIWRIADRTGSGTLSRDELVVAIRLMGWAQVGETINEELLSKAAPLPKLKGFTDKLPKKADVPPPPINFDDTTVYKHNFKGSGSITGFSGSQENIVADAYTEPTIAVGHAAKFMELVEGLGREPETMESREFALAVQLLKSWLISTPSSVPETLGSEKPAREPLTHEPSPSFLPSKLNISPPDSEQYHDLFEDIQFPEKVESGIRSFIADIEKEGNIIGNAVCNFAAEYNLSLVDLVALWGETDIHANYTITANRLAMFSVLLRRKLANTMTPNAVASDSRLRTPMDPLIIAPPPSRPLEGDEPSSVRDINQDLSPTSALPVYTPTLPLSHSIPEPRLPISVMDDAVLTELKREITRLSQLAENFISTHSTNQNILHRVDDLQDDKDRLNAYLSEEEKRVSDLSFSNEQLKQQVDDHLRENTRLRAELSNMEKERAISEENTSALDKDVLKQQSPLQEFQQQPDSVNVPEQQLAERMEILKNVGHLASGGSPRSESRRKQGLRMLFLRASLGESRTAIAEALSEAEGLRQIVAAQSEQIITLRRQILDLEHGAHSITPSKDDVPSYLDSPFQFRGQRSQSYDYLTDSDSSSEVSGPSEPPEDNLEPFPLSALSTQVGELRGANEDLRKRNYSIKLEFLKFQKDARRAQERQAQKIGQLTAQLANSIAECTALREWSLEQDEKLRRSQAETALVQEEADHLGKVIDSQTQALFKLRARISKSDSQARAQTSVPSGRPPAPGPRKLPPVLHFQSQNLSAK